MRSGSSIRRLFTLLGAFAGLGVAIAACGRTSLNVLDANEGGSGGSTGTQPTGSGGGGEGGEGAGGAEPCGGPTDCDDGDACTSDVCSGGLCQHSPRDDDMDGFGAEICGGNDCNDFNPSVHPGAPEICTDAADNDCNGVADCFDLACTNAPMCGCTPSPGGESCENGVDDDCDTIVDCFDSDCAGTPICGCSDSETGKCGNGVDDDCDGAFDCDDDPDCSSDELCLCQVFGEICDNDEDDDCDLLVDCGDPDCDGIFPCACQPPGSPEDCSDGTDNDCDTLVDCADPQCISSPACQNCVPEVCDDGLDNNCDNKIDCADPACFFSPSCAPTPEQCNNGLDDDNDTLVDCQDPDCANNPLCVLEQANCLSPKLIPGTGTFTGDTTGHVSETKGVCGGDAGEAVFYFVLTDPSFVHLDSIGTSFDSTLYVRTGACNSGAEIGCDDDSAGSWAATLDFTILYPGTYYVFLDGFTVDPFGGPNEGPFVLNAEIVPNPQEICADGLDNDGDVYVDCADPDCTTVGACLNCVNGGPPGPEFGVGACTDGVDNDCDGTQDCADDDCSASDYYVTECCDGADENGNGIVDDFNCRCASDADCGDGQFCYTHTSYTCGVPCNAFFGNICPFVAAGSYCNMSTLQCEF